MRCPRCKREIQGDRCRCGLRVVRGVKGTPKATQEPSGRQTAYRVDIAARGRELWAELHSYPWTDATSARQFLQQWIAKIPSYGCSCRRDFDAILREIKPRYDDLFAWSVDVHNAVNRKLGKPEISQNDALVIWRQVDEQPLPAASSRLA